MGFIDLSEYASDITEALRADEHERAQELLPSVQEEYQHVAEAIAAFR